ncbi:MAG TPA: sulfotransferase [Chryseolinea sp.]|nr:sulfotransferase [Chryseolinea sp.]HPM31749.1 sulfotransferase [Chryseolinea sp.]
MPAVNENLVEPSQNKNLILPNFLIAGSAKCGTSSLHSYLAQHPEIFMSKKKEPRFLSSQGMSFPLNGPLDYRVEKWYVKKFADYCDLFLSALNFKVVGESSADTLYFHSHTISTIKKYLGDPKIVIVLRNPVKRSFSAYQHLVRDNREPLSFEDALLQESDRIKNNWELIYHYRAVSHYYEPVKAFLDSFTNVKVVFNEDLEKRPHEVLSEVFGFLGVDTSFKVKDSTTKHNMSGKPRSRWLHEFLFEGHALRDFLRPAIRFFIPSEKRKSISLKIQQKNLTQMKINPETAAMLKNEYREEILKLEKLLNHDLSSWLM